MHNRLHDIVQRTVDASHLTDHEKEELQKEITTHVADQAHELELRGYTEERVMEEIQRTFGDTHDIGKQLFMVHRRFERIPWFGPLLYYQPVRLALQILIGDFFVVIAAFGIILVFGLTGIIDIIVDDAAEAIMLTMIALLPVVQGIWIAERAGSGKKFFGAIALSLVPFLLIGYVIALRMLLDWNVPTYTGMDLLAPTIIGAHTIFVVIGAGIHMVYTKIHQKIRYGTR